MAKATRLYNRGQATEQKNNLIRNLQKLGDRHNTWQVFSDFVMCSACAISNAVDPLHRDEREKLYMESIGRYSHDEAALFPEMFAELVLIMENTIEDAPGHDDVLGEIYHALELHNKWTGQFFTPGNVAYMMAQINTDKEYVLRQVEESGYITVAEEKESTLIQCNRGCA